MVTIFLPKIIISVRLCLRNYWPPVKLHFQCKELKRSKIAFSKLNSHDFELLHTLFRAKNLDITDIISGTCTRPCYMIGTIFSQYLFNPDIFRQLSAASLTEVVLTQFSWEERVGWLGPMGDSYFIPPKFNHKIMRHRTDCNNIWLRSYWLTQYCPNIDMGIILTRKKS